MGLSTRKTAAGHGRSAQRRSLRPHEASESMEFELLRLWIGISRLHEALSDKARPRSSKPARARGARRYAIRHARLLGRQRTISSS